MARRTLLTPERHNRIVEYVRAGAYDYVAAQAVGIDASTFYNWMKWGRNKRPKYVQFFKDVTAAQAEARVRKEIEVAQTDPFKWLRYGPGRERPGKPGWTNAVAVTGADGGPIVVVNWDDATAPNSED